MLTKKQFAIKIIINLALTLVVILVVITATTILGGEISKTADALHSKASLIKLVESRSLDAAMLQKKLEPLGDIDAKIESAFPTQDNVVDFVSAMDALAVQSQVTQTLSFNAPNPIPSSDILPLAVMEYSGTVTGPVNILSAYLKNFEDMTFFTQITSMNLTSSSGWSNDATLNFQARLYIRNK